MHSTAGNGGMCCSDHITPSSAGALHTQRQHLLGKYHACKHTCTHNTPTHTRLSFLHLHLSYCHRKAFNCSRGSTSTSTTSMPARNRKQRASYHPPCCWLLPPRLLPLLLHYCPVSLRPVLRAWP
jgi:hypothetical protein